MEQTQLIRICQEPTIVLGMDVSHGPLRQPESPSVAAVISYAFVYNYLEYFFLLLGIIYNILSKL